METLILNVLNLEYLSIDIIFNIVKYIKSRILLLRLKLTFDFDTFNHVSKTWLLFIFVHSRCIFIKNLVKNILEIFTKVQQNNQK